MSKGIPNRCPPDQPDRGRMNADEFKAWRDERKRLYGGSKPYKPVPEMTIDDLIAAQPKLPPANEGPIR